MRNKQKKVLALLLAACLPLAAIGTALATEATTGEPGIVAPQDEEQGTATGQQQEQETEGAAAEQGAAGEMTAEQETAEETDAAQGTTGATAAAQGTTEATAAAQGATGEGVEPPPVVQSVQGTPRTAPMTSFEREIVEQAFRLLPKEHPFVVAYEKTYGIPIRSYTKEINGITFSGVPFEMGGAGNFEGFSSSWWERTGDSYYPVKGLDCAGFISWVYRQVGYSIPNGSAGQFFNGKAGVSRTIPGLRAHKVIPTLGEAMIGDVLYNTKTGTYRSGDGSHIQLYLGTADLLGISKELTKLIPKFPCDAHLTLDCGWSDGVYYFVKMQELGIAQPRLGMGGVGVQFMTSITSGGTVLYQCPQKTYTWKHPQSLRRFYIESRLEFSNRPLQHRSDVPVPYPMNLSRPIVRPDVG